jgi:hypothetical protein
MIIERKYLSTHDPSSLRQLARLKGMGGEESPFGLVCRGSGSRKPGVLGRVSICQKVV